MNPAEPALRRLHFELPADAAALVEKIRTIETFLREAGCDSRSIHQMSVVAEEVLTNIQREAWPGCAPGRCAVDVAAALQGDAVHVSLRTEDDGVAFDPTAAEPPDVEASLDERSIGGLGIFLVRAMTDEQTYHRANGHNIFEIRKVCRLA